MYGYKKLKKDVEVVKVNDILSLATEGVDI